MDVVPTEMRVGVVPFGSDRSEAEQLGDFVVDIGPGGAICRFEGKSEVAETLGALHHLPTNDLFRAYDFLVAQYSRAVGLLPGIVEFGTPGETDESLVTIDLWDLPNAVTITSIDGGNALGVANLRGLQHALGELQCVSNVEPDKGGGGICVVLAQNPSTAAFNAIANICATHAIQYRPELQLLKITATVGPRESRSMTASYQAATGNWHLSTAATGKLDNQALASLVNSRYPGRIRVKGRMAVVEPAGAMTVPALLSIITEATWPARYEFEYRLQTVDHPRLTVVLVMTPGGEILLQVPSCSNLLTDLGPRTLSLLAKPAIFWWGQVTEANDCEITIQPTPTAQLNLLATIEAILQELM